MKRFALITIMIVAVVGYSITVMATKSSKKKTSLLNAIINVDALTRALQTKKNNGQPPPAKDNGAPQISMEEFFKGFSSPQQPSSQPAEEIAQKLSKAMPLPPPPIPKHRNFFAIPPELIRQMKAEAERARMLKEKARMLAEKARREAEKARRRAQRAKRKKRLIKKRIILSPLQNYSVNRLTIKGIMVDHDIHFALVVAPDGETYIVKIGDIVGLRDYKVTDINLDGIVLKEGNSTRIIPFDHQ